MVSDRAVWLYLYAKNLSAVSGIRPTSAELCGLPMAASDHAGAVCL